MRQFLFAALLALLSLSAHATVYKVNGQVPEMFIGLSSDTKPVHGLHPGARFMETDTNNVYTWNGSDAPGTSANWVENYDAVTLGTKLAPERNVDSTTGTGYSSVSQECKSSGEIDLASGSNTIYPGPALICGFMVSTTIGTAASSIDDNATAKIPLPVSFPVGVYQVFGTIIATSLKYTRGASGTGKFVVWYRPIDPSVNW